MAEVSDRPSKAVPRRAMGPVPKTREENEVPDVLGVSILVGFLGFLAGMGFGPRFGALGFFVGFVGMFVFLVLRLTKKDTNG